MIAVGILLRVGLSLFGLSVSLDKLMAAYVSIFAVYGPVYTLFALPATHRFLELMAAYKAGKIELLALFGLSVDGGAGAIADPWALALGSALNTAIFVMYPLSIATLVDRIVDAEGLDRRRALSATTFGFVF